MPDPRDPHAAERLAARDRAYRTGIAEYHAQHGLDSDAHMAATEIANCGLCDDDGYRGNRVCDHIDRTDVARRGAAKCREALAAKQLKLDEARDA